MSTTPQTKQVKLRQILENLTEQTSLRMMNMKLAPEITSAKIIELENEAEAAIKALVAEHVIGEVIEPKILPTWESSQDFLLFVQKIRLEKL